MTDDVLFITPNLGEDSDYNKPLYGLSGQYTLSENISLPYFMAAMPLERAINELKIAEQVPPSMENKWSLTELYQREVDRDRVQREIVHGYLADPGKIKFFNALTVVLMPKNDAGVVTDEFLPLKGPEPPVPWSASNAYDKNWSHERAERYHAHGVQYITFGSQARLRWETNSVHAVVVDGQHRLVSLHEYRENIRAGALKDVEKATRIPVIIVLLSKLLGLKDNRQTSSSGVRVIARELFTDLNKNAKKVDRARELILDDKSISALCVRELVTTKTSTDNNVKLPLTLVRWQEANNRFDSSYYLNSLIHLEAVVDEILQLNHPRDPMESRQVESFIQSVSESLMAPGVELKVEGRTLLKFYKEDYCDEDGNPFTPFTKLPEIYLEAAVKGFQLNHATWMLALLTEFRPYKIVLDYARKHNLVEGVFGKFYAQTRLHQSKIKEHENSLNPHWHKTQILEHINKIEAIKRSDWAFKAIFQKAVMRLGRTVGFEAQNDTNIGGIKELIQFLNALHKEGLFVLEALLEDLPYKLWTFVATNPGNGKIKVSKKVEGRILSILRLWYYCHRKRLCDQSNGLKPKSAKELVNYFSISRNSSTWPGCDAAVKDIRKAFDVKGFLGPEELSPKEKEKQISERVLAIINCGLEAWGKCDVSDGSSEDDKVDDELVALMT